MKYLKILYLLVIFIPGACNEDETLSEREVPVLFNIGTDHLLENGRIADISKAHAIVISVQDPSGKRILEAKEIRLNDSYTSEPVNLKPGRYIITGFMVVDERDSILFISPKEGSERASLVSDPLPVPFQVRARQVNRVAVEVLRAAGEPEEYGYATFSYYEVNTFSFRLQAFAIDEGQPAEYAEPEIIMVNSRVQIFLESESEINKIYDDSVTAMNNIVELRDNFSSTPLLVKVSNINYKTFRKTFTRAELEEFMVNPMKVILERHEFKEILVIKGRFNTVYTPSAYPNILFYVTTDGDAYKMDISDLDNPGTPVLMGSYGYIFGEDPYGKLYLGNNYSTDLGNTWRPVTDERPVHSFVEFKGVHYGLNGNKLYREISGDQWELVTVLPFFSGPATTDKRLIVYDNKLFAGKGLLVSEDGQTFTETRDLEYINNGWEPAGMFTAMGNLYMKTESQAIFGEIYQWNGNGWDYVYGYDAEFASPFFSGEYKQRMVLVDFNYLKIFNSCGTESCQPVYSNFFNWIPDQMPPATIRGRHIGGDRIFIQDRVTSDNVEYLFALDLSEIEFQ